MLFSLKFAITFALMLGVPAELSVNSYEDPAYPGRCVIDIPSSVVLLTAGQAFKLPNLDCTTIFCISDGWGTIFTCEKQEPPDDCRFSEPLNPDAFYPECCKRRVVCD
ncbi:uncharacterized protein LOC117900892 [Drosophila subobscura]|uniref:uncharacterized protein LOC117900892 n=1 Tax=Drosophila subobscura TaxID=7241 RepID=UPI00155A5C55|nr:uncharacterized protein LOC117900892 [Drosophila subobscura]